MSQTKLLTDPVGPTLLRLAFPMLLGVLGIVAFNLVDTYFIGQLGARELAAVGFTFPIVSLVGSIAQGLGIGVTSIVSASLGTGQRERAARETTDSLLLGVVVVALVSTLGFFTIEPLFTLLGAAPETLPLIREYMEVWYVTIVFLIVPMVGNSAIRATGDTKTPSYIMLAAVAINLVLDPLFIFGYGPVPALGLRGAALATAISRGFTFLLATYILWRKLDLLRMPASVLGFWNCARAVLNIALPAGAARAINPLGIAVLTGLLATFGTAAVAGYGVGSRIEILALTLVLALSTAVGPFVGQNFGAKQFGRIRSATKQSFLFCLGSGLVVAALLFLFPESIARLFSDSEAVRVVVREFLTIIPWAYTLLGVTLVGATVLNSIQRPWLAAGLSLLQMFALLVPLAYWGASLYGVAGAFYGVAAAYVLAGVATFGVVHWALGRLGV